MQQKGRIMEWKLLLFKKMSSHQDSVCDELTTMRGNFRYVAIVAYLAWMNEGWPQHILSNI